MQPLDHTSPAAGGAAVGALRHDPVEFARKLRTAGIEVPVSAVILWVEALGSIGTDNPASIYWAARCTLVRRQEDVTEFDAAFAQFFHGVDPPQEPADSPGAPAVGNDSNDPSPVEDSSDRDLDDDTADDGTLDDGTVDDGTVDAADDSIAWSRTEVLRRKDLATCTPEELEELWTLLACMRLDAPKRRSPRLRASNAGDLDLRRTLRSALRRGGEPVQPRHSAPKPRPRRLVLLIDVSGSMEPYARALLRFAHAVVQSGRHVEVFAFATRLTRLTRDLAARQPDAAMRHATASAADLAGGTRMGEALRDFNERFGMRGIARGADVVVLSDGWDRGDPALVGAQMERLARVAHRVVWVNPLKASRDYAPLAAGMAAALPHVDEFVEGHSFSSLDDLASLLADTRASNRPARRMAQH